MANSDKRDKGLAQFKKVMQFAMPAVDGDLFLEETVDHLFAELWSRPALGTRERRLVTLTALMAFGNETALSLHLNGAMKSGDLSDEEIDELVLHVAHYCGWPAAAVASQVVSKLRAQRAAE